MAEILGGLGQTTCQVTPMRFFFFSGVGGGALLFPKGLFGRQYEAFKWTAKNQTLGWTVYFAFPTAAVKIKKNKQQITLHALVLFILCLL